MHKLKVYIDTSVIGGCFDKEFSEWSNKLFDEFINGNMIAVISDIISDELEKAPEYIQNKIKEIPIPNIIQIWKNDEADIIAKKYVEYNAISKKFYNDALHIAIATINKVDILVSWNFKHIVNYNRIKLYNSINMMNSYQLIEIRTPREVVGDEK